MEQFLYGIVTTINSYMSDYILIILLIGTGIFFSFKTGFVQLRGLVEGFKKSFSSFSLNGKKNKDGLSTFQALATAVATQVGTGNIVGACGAILAGGPGAILWMWIIAFFGMATIYAEAVLAQKSRVVNEDGTVTGGPVYYIKKAFKGNLGKFLAGFFAVAITIALGFIGSMTLSNSISEACSSAFHIDPWIVSLVIVIITAIVVFGGVTRIASTAEKIVPLMSILYLVGGIIIICARIKFIPATLWMIIKYAFTPNAIIGGGIGTAIKIAISQGAKRGLFSNEAGMGSTPHIHALAKVDKAHDEGLVAMVGMFIDTFVVITFTALVVISTLYQPGGVLESGVCEGVTKANMAQLAFGEVFGDNIGAIFVAICLVFFAFSSILGWNLYGKLNFEYLFGKKMVPLYFAISLVFIFLGGIFSNDLVWELSDFFNQIMVIPNVMALIALSNVVKEEASCKKK
ncbi:MAG: amino acid carrier protein [Clostridia bacterium]|nr:amino acid carrier protein [Clostridia bacterium]